MQCEFICLFFKTDPQEVFNAINSLKNTNSTGFDEIPTKLLKKCAYILCEPLTKLINMSFESGVFPDQLKLTVIKLLHKKGELSDISNYRPIALLSTIAKVYEKIMANRIYDFLIKFNILNNRQNGYIRGRSTNRAIFQVLEEILTGINEDEYTVCVCMDLSKAFDSVDYETLYDKLELLGFRGLSLDLIKSYLTNRQQCVVTEDSEGKQIYSDWCVVKRGVPQGSILGPLLFCFMSMSFLISFNI